MPKVIITANVEDTTKWENGFRTHGELFRRQTVTVCQYSLGKDNQVAVCFEVEDLDVYMKVLDSPETAEAMAADGLDRDSVKIFALDKEYRP